jgi:hypothetical protein
MASSQLKILWTGMPIGRPLGLTRTVRVISHSRMIAGLGLCRTVRICRRVWRWRLSKLQITILRRMRIRRRENKRSSRVRVQLKMSWWCVLTHSSLKWAVLSLNSCSSRVTWRQISPRTTTPWLKALTSTRWDRFNWENHRHVCLTSWDLIRPKDWKL